MLGGIGSVIVSRSAATSAGGSGGGTAVIVGNRLAGCACRICEAGVIAGLAEDARYEVSRSVTGLADLSRERDATSYSRLRILVMYRRHSDGFQISRRLYSPTSVIS